MKRKIYKIALVTALCSFSLIVSSCSLLKPEKNNNCLNPTADCFVSDVTRPYVVSAFGYRNEAEYLAGTPLGNGEGTSQLYALKVVFSEKMRNMTSSSLYTISGSGATGAGLSITSVEEIADYTVLIKFDDTIIPNNGIGDLSDGPILFTFALKDFTGAQLRSDGSFTDTVQFTGAVSGGIPTNTGSTIYVSNAIHNGANPYTIEYWHNITEDVNNNYMVKIQAAASATACFDGSNNFLTAGMIVNGTAATLTAGFDNRLSLTLGDAAHTWNFAALGEGNYSLKLCVRNTNINQTRSREITVVIDNTPPVVSAFPGGGAYRNPQSVTFTCGNIPDKIAYSESSGIPADPTFDLARNITSGTLYSSAWATPSTTGTPVTTNLKVRCVDQAGNPSAIISETYTIDNSLPEIVITSLTPTTLSSGTTNTASLTFTSSVSGVNWYVHAGNITTNGGCTGGSPFANGTVSGPINVTNLGASITNLSSQVFTICASNASATNFARTQFTLTRDNTAPVFNGSFTGNFLSSTQVQLTWTPASDFSAVTYEICRAIPPANCGSFGAHASNIGGNSYIDTVETGTTYNYRVRAIDAAGNTTALPGEIVMAPPSLIINAPTFAGGGSIGVNVIVLENSTQTRNDIISLTTGAMGGPFYHPENSEYRIGITSSPADKVCSVREIQKGKFGSGQTQINIDCADGYYVAGSHRALPAARMNYHLYRGTLQAGSDNATASYRDITVAGSNLYIAGHPTGVNIISRTAVTSGLVTPSVFRSMPVGQVVYSVTSDGNNLYFSVDGGTTKAIYKTSLASSTTTDYTELVSGLTAPRGLVIENDNLYFIDGTTVKSLNLQTLVQTTLVTGMSSTPDDLELAGNNFYMGISHRVYSASKSGGSASLVTGSATSGFIDGPFTSARFNTVTGLTYDGVANLYITELNGHRIRRLNLQKSQVTTITGNGGSSGYIVGTGAASQLPFPFGIATDGRRLYVANQGINARISRIIDSGLEGYWPLAGNTQDFGSEPNSVSAGAVGGTVNYTNGRYNEPTGAANLSQSGSSDIKTKDIDLTATAFSFSAFIRISDMSNINSILGDQVASGTYTDGPYEFWWYVDQNGTMYIRIWASDGSVHLFARTAVGVIKANQWYHVAYVYRSFDRDFLGGKLIVNGKDVTSFSSKLGTPFNPAQSLQIGRGTDDGSNATSINDTYFTGQMADVRFYSRALNDGEIIELARDADPSQIGASYPDMPTGLLVHHTFYNNGTSPSNNDFGALVASFSGGSFSLTHPRGKDSLLKSAKLFEPSGSNSQSTAVISGLPASNHPRSICAWVNLKSYPPSAQSYGTIISYGANNANDAQALIIFSDGSPGYNYSPGGGSRLGNRVHLNAWTHLCGVYTGGELWLYQNGKRTTPSSLAVNLNTSETSTLNIANHVTGIAPKRIHAEIDDVRIYNSALTPDQVRQLAVRIPRGLVAAYDFTDNGGGASDTYKDVSGWAQNLTSGTAMHRVNGGRFGNEDDSFEFNGIDEYLENPGTNLLLATGNADRTICAWARGATGATGLDIILSYGNRTTQAGSLIGVTLSGNPRIDGGSWANYISAFTVGTPTYFNYETWQHVCLVVNVSFDRVYFNGSLIPEAPTGDSIIQNTPAGPINIARIGTQNYFPGRIDDIQIYNRALSQEEILALVQQPNKRIFLTSASFNGNLGGVAGADAKCMAEAGAGLTYKALLSSAANERIPCTSLVCSTGKLTEQYDWVMRPFVTYVRPDQQTIIKQANENGIWLFILSASLDGNAIANEPWTGINTNWLAAGVNNTCSNWTYGSVNVPPVGAYGSSNVTSTSTIFTNNSTCDQSRQLICVEQ